MPIFSCCFFSVAVIRLHHLGNTKKVGCLSSCLRSQAMLEGAAMSGSLKSSSKLSLKGGHSGYFKNLCEEGQVDELLLAVRSLHQEGIHLSTGILFCLLQQCINKKDLARGREAYHLIAKCGYGSNAFLASHLIHLFAVCGSLPEAYKIFINLLDQLCLLGVQSLQLM